MKATNRFGLVPVILTVIFFAVSCKNDKKDDEKVMGFEFLNKIPGLWHGGVSSSTSAGNFDIWYVDFRPVSAAQVSQFSLLDTNTVNNISFFIVKHNNELKLAMRTEGCFKNHCCVTYEVIDSVADQEGFYRFSDFVRGTTRAYSEFRFRGDSLIMKVYTNRFDSLDTVRLHTIWTAKSGGRSNITEALSHFGYPQPMMIKDFSNAFPNMTESIFFTFENDPYSSVTQPYMGSATVNVTIDTSLVTGPSDEIFLLLTTQPLFNGTTYIEDNLKYVSKYVYISASTSVYRIRNVHPGKYYIYSLIDRDHDKRYLRGDYMNSNVTNYFTVSENQDATVNTDIDFVIP